MKESYTKNIHRFFLCLPNPGFRSVKVQTETFFKKDSRDFENPYLNLTLTILNLLLARCVSGWIVRQSVANLSQQFSIKKHSANIEFFV